MDGTLADTSLGILNSHRYAHLIMRRPIPCDKVLKSVIGGPLLQTYQDRLGFSTEDAKTAVMLYRDYYKREGMYQATLYPGISNLLYNLSREGVHLGVATLKAEAFAIDMLKRMKVYKCFSAICGMDKDDTQSKAQLVQRCMRETSAGIEETLLVGDSIHDWDGARTAGIDFIGVTYGFGFLQSETYSDFPLCHSPEEILSQIKNSL